MTEPQETLWATLVRQAHELRRASPVLAPGLDALVLERTCFADALCAVLSDAMFTSVPRSIRLTEVFGEALRDHPDIAESAAVDLQKLAAVNPACPDVLTGLLSFRGFQALQLHRIDHALWKRGQQQLAVVLQNWGAIRYAMDIHPAARIGSGVFLDHGMGLVIGATAVVEDGANIWHGVTLGSTLTQAGDRHPKVRRNATICAGATVLGNIEIGEGAIIAAGSVVLKSVAPGMVVAGVPARVIGAAPTQLDAIDHAQKTTSTQAQEI